MGSRQLTLDRLVVNMTILVAGGKIMLGLYDNTPGDLYPNNRLESGEVLTDSTGVKEVIIVSGRAIPPTTGRF